MITQCENQSSSMTELSLFSGYAGFSLGLKLAGIETRCVGYVEQDA